MTMMNGDDDKNKERDGFFFIYILHAKHMDQPHPARVEHLF